MPKNNNSSNGSKRNDENETEDEFLKSVAQKYNINYTKNKEKIVVELALKGHSLLNEGKIDGAENIAKILANLSDKWKDPITKMKTHLFQGQIAIKKDEDAAKHFESALKIAKKQRTPEVILGIRIQLAYEKFRDRKYKDALKQIRKIEKDSEGVASSRIIVNELKSRIYWETDNYSKGFYSTYEWFRDLKKTNEDLQSLFMVIVYLLTIMSSFSDVFDSETQTKIKGEITETLSRLGNSHFLFDRILDNLDTLFSKSLMIVEPELLQDFADLMIKTARWTEPDKYLNLCSKLSNAFFEIDMYEKAIEMVDYAIKFTQDRNYSKIEYNLRIRRAEILSTVFYFSAIAPHINPIQVKQLYFQNGSKEEKLYVQNFSLPSNQVPSISYSNFLKLIEKSSHFHKQAEEAFSIPELSSHAIRGYFILNMNIEKETISLLMQEDFSIEKQETEIFHATVLPQYRVIGVLSEENRSISDIQEVEDLLQLFQRSMNCPASSVSIIFPKDSPHLQVFKYYLHDPNYTNIKRIFLEAALQLEQEYAFVKNENFLKIFNSDPITIFDLSLRKEDQLEPLINLLKKATKTDINPSQLKDFFSKIIYNIVHRVDTKMWRDFYYEYAWIHCKGELKDLPTIEIKRREELISKLATISKNSKDLEKKLESLYYSTYIELQLNKKKVRHLEELKHLALETNNKKYLNVVELFELLLRSTEMDEKSMEDIYESFCNLCHHMEWNKILDFYVLLLSKIPSFEILWNMCKKNQKKGLYNILIFIQFISKIENDVEYNIILDSLMKTLDRLEEIKKEMDFVTNIWKYAYVQVNIILYNVIKKHEKVKEKLKIQIVNNLLEFHKWVEDPKLLIQILIIKIRFLLSKADYSQASQYYHWVEQLYLYNWDIFQRRENKKIEEEIKDIKSKIESQHLL